MTEIREKSNKKRIGAFGLKLRRYRLQAGPFVKTEDYVHVLHSLPGRAFHHIINGGYYN
jgi:hypothetical protein